MEYSPFSSPWEYSACFVPCLNESEDACADRQHVFVTQGKASIGH